MTTTQFVATVNATEYPPHLKHKVIFETFDGLSSGESMLLVNDHDPKPLYFQFSSTRNGQFEWVYLEQGPEVFRINISKVE